MDEFFPEHKESAQVTNKKRRAEKQPIDDDLRKRAQLYCRAVEKRVALFRGPTCSFRPRKRVQGTATLAKPSL